MPDAYQAAQTQAALSQAHAAWMQVWVGALGVLATFAAVVVALAGPWLARRRQDRLAREILFTAASTIVRLHRTLETQLLQYNPGRGLSLVSLTRKRLEHVLPRTDEYRMLTCALALHPLLEQVEEGLGRWTMHLTSQGGFSPEGFRLGMRAQAARARELLQAYGDPGLVRKLDAQPAFATSDAG